MGAEQPDREPDPAVGDAGGPPAGGEVGPSAHLDPGAAGGPTARGLPPVPMGISLVLVGAAFVVVAIGVHYIAGVIAPTFFALTLVLTVVPLRQLLTRRHVPAWLASIVVLVLLYALLLGIIAGFVVSVQQLVQILPDYADNFTTMYRQVLVWLAQRGVDTSNADLLLAQVDFNRIVSVLQGLATSVSSTGTTLFILVMALAFLLVDSTTMDGRLSQLRRYQPYLAAAMGDFASRVRRYWLVNTLFGVIVAVLDMIVLIALDVPLPLVWGLFSWVTNYIPNVGFIIGVLPPATLALLVGGPIDALIVIIAYSVLNFVIQAIIQPKYTGDAVGINTTVTFISLVFWTAVVGPLGSILAVPLTLFSKSLLIDSSPRLQWVNIFLRSKDAEEPPVRPHWPQVPHMATLPRWIQWTEERAERPAPEEPGGRSGDDRSGGAQVGPARRSGSDDQPQDNPATRG